MHLFRPLLCVATGLSLLSATVLPVLAQTNISGTINNIVEGDANVVGETRFVAGGGVTGTLTDRGHALTIETGTFGGSGLYSGGMAALGFSNVTIHSGTFGGSGIGAAPIYLTDNSRLKILNGLFGAGMIESDAGSINASKYSNVEISGGTFGGSGAHSGYVDLRDYSKARISGGTFGGSGVVSGTVRIEADNHVTILGGTFGGSGLESGNVLIPNNIGNRNVGILGGTFGGSGERSGNVVTFGANVLIYGGTFGGSGVGSGNVTVWNRTLNIYGGTFGGSGAGSGNVNANGGGVGIHGGTLAGTLSGRIVRYGSGPILQGVEDGPTITWSGGTFEQGVFLGFEDEGGEGGGREGFGVSGGPHLILNGNGLFYETESDHYTDPDRYGDRVFDLNFISGTLLDGTRLQFVPMLVEHGSNAVITINNVPEPGSLALLLGLGMAGVGVLRRQRKNRE